MSIENFYYLNVFGEINSVSFPLGPEAKGIFIKYDIVAGDDWEVISGVTTGLTQCSNPRKGHDSIVFNMPIACTFRFTNIFGWPQIVFSLYGTNVWGTEVSLGYARIHVPCQINSSQQSGLKAIHAPIIQTISTNIWSAIANFLLNRNPELREPNILLNGMKSKNLFTSSYGDIFVLLETITKGTEKLDIYS
ncbi:CLUMA_CG020187, isoform A [Clunio marinus]|uniref:B9 domain-containing protein 1 n=1 Tax=Clunio marinus TaxID=568069 RepID=A0A1J1J606_9DIPT|nr:CLUMA_CG020187, isoform A [Clunio marinus]